MADQQFPKPTEENNFGTTNHLQIPTHCGPRVFGGATHCAVSVSGSQPLFNWRTHAFHVNEDTDQVGFSPPLGGTTSYFDFDENIPPPSHHTASSEILPIARDHDSFKPHVFEGEPQLVPTASSGAPITAASNKAETMMFRHRIAWQDRSSDNQLHVANSSLSLTFEPSLKSMPNTPAAISNFEPMASAWETHTAPFLHTAMPSPNLSSVASQSPASSAMPTFSRTNSYNLSFMGGNSPENVQVPADTTLSVRFEPVSPSESSPSTQVYTQKLPRHQLTNEKRKSSIEATRQIPFGSTNTTSQDPKGDEHTAISNSSMVSNDDFSYKQPVSYPNRSSSPIIVPVYWSPSIPTSISLHIQGQARNETAQSYEASIQRERNRTVAVNFRAKTRVRETELQETERAMSAQNLELSAQVMDLREQILNLKNELLRHGHCDCELIRRYLKKEAIRIGGGT